MNHRLSCYSLYVPRVEDRVLVELHRAAALAGRGGIVVPSEDLEVADRQTGSHARTKDAISRLLKANKVVAVRKDLLVLPDATGRVTVTIPELVDVVAPEPYLITGGRALQHHHLTDQHFFSVAVLVPTRVSTFAYRGERAVFLATDPKRIWGWQGGERPRIATPERVILDVLSNTRYSVPFSQALTALNLEVQRHPGFLERLESSVRRFESHAAARRVGLLVDRLFGPDAAAPFRELIGASRTPVLLRRGADTQGPIDPTWRVIVNASTQPEGATHE
jgi:predicted transcriptional regulator of viral defense system